MAAGPATLIDLMRHGAPVGGRRYRGQIDDPLSDAGWRQMWSAVGEEAPWSHIVSSPLSRCRAFADALGERHRLPVAVDPRLMEVGFGVWEGRTANELEQTEPGILQRFYHDPEYHRPDGAEPLDQFSARVVAAWRDLAATYSGRHLLVVTHAGVIRAAMAHLLGAPLATMYRIHVENAGITRFRMDGQRPPTLQFHGRSVGPLA
jgi:alpha-ribazole phosphatase/probable phosphoglycerate mutase